MLEFSVEGRIAVVTPNHPEVRNAVDQSTAAALAAAFRRFDADRDLDIAVLTGANGNFCAGADRMRRSRVHHVSRGEPAATASFDRPDPVVSI